MNQKIRELDGIRGIAILMVLVWHYFTNQYKPLTPGSFFSDLHLWSTAFWSGVDLFFILSGFLISGIIIDNHSKKNFLKVFWIRRACRIFPALIALLVFCGLFQIILDKERFAWLFESLMPWWTYLSFTQNLAMGVSNSFGGHFLGITWSLAIEEQFYLLVPFLFYYFGRKNWIPVILLLVLIAIILRWLFPGFHAYVNLPFRMDTLLLGVLVAVIYRKEHLWHWLIKQRVIVLTIFIGFSLLTFIILITFGFSDIRFIWFASLYSIFLLVVLLYQGSQLTWILRSSILRFWGSIAYGLYLIHQAISGLLHGWLRNGEVPSLIDPFAVKITMLAFLLSTLIAWISFRSFESFFLQLGKKHKYGSN